MTEEKARTAKNLIEKIEELQGKKEKIERSLNNNKVIQLSNDSYNSFECWCLVLDKELVSVLLEVLNQRLKKLQEELNKL